ncbi:MAG: tRNA (guanosine(46)-N7)-methyltransferase TrmB [Methylovirgula sp.]
MSANLEKPDPQSATATRLHGRHKGKKLRPRQAKLLETLLPQLALDFSCPIADAAALFARQPAAVWLEIGFGGGEHLAAEAEANPNCGLIGCEYFENGLAKALALIEAKNLGNVRLHCGDAGQVIDALPAASLARVFLLYPDPWPKRRQRKRRLLSDAMLAALARVMRSGGELRFATDVDDNAGWTLARVLRSPDFVWKAATAADWHEPWSGWNATRYEAKALAAGRKPVYLTLQRR